jgi:hypothetical protein
LKLSWLSLGIDSPRSGSIWLRSTPTRGLVCSAHEWAQNIARVIDWLAMYLTHRWRFRGIDPAWLRAFAKHSYDDADDYLDLAS